MTSGTTGHWVKGEFYELLVAVTVTAMYNHFYIRKGQHLSRSWYAQDPAVTYPIHASCATWVQGEFNV